jgi:hypothetical protein
MYSRAVLTGEALGHHYSATHFLVPSQTIWEMCSALEYIRRRRSRRPKQPAGVPGAAAQSSPEEKVARLDSLSHKRRLLISNRGSLNSNGKDPPTFTRASNGKLTGSARYRTQINISGQSRHEILECRTSRGDRSARVADGIRNAVTCPTRRGEPPPKAVGDVHGTVDRASDSGLDRAAVSDDCAGRWHTDS